MKTIICFISSTANSSSPAPNSYQSHYSLQEVVPKLPPPHQSTNPYLYLSLIRVERHVIHADHSNLHHLEGWLWGTHSCFTVSYWTMQAVMRGGWILMGEAQVTTDSLVALLVLKMSQWCHYWRSSWLRIAHILTMNQGLANLSVGAWSWIRSQIIRLLPYVALAALENWDCLFFPQSQYAFTLFTLCRRCVHFFQRYLSLSIFLFTAEVILISALQECVGDVRLHSAGGPLSSMSNWWAASGWRKQGQLSALWDSLLTPLPPVQNPS